jgi:hypothetical protein
MDEHRRSGPSVSDDPVEVLEDPGIEATGVDEHDLVTELTEPECVLQHGPSCAALSRR